MAGVRKETVPAVSDGKRISEPSLLTARWRLLRRIRSLQCSDRL